MVDKSVNPLSYNVPIVNKDGTPTNEFMRKWAQQGGVNGSIPDFTSAAVISGFLDTLGKTPGSILYRNTTVWTAFPPGTAGQFLTTTGSTPLYVDPPAASPGLGFYSCFFSDGTTQYAAMVNSVADPEVIVDGSGVPVYVPL